MLDLNTIRIALEEKLSELQVRAAEIENTLTSRKNADSEERALELEDDQTTAVIGEITDAEIRDIKVAIARIEAGKYFTCVQCGKQIAEERLLVLPSTSKCAHCA